MIQNSSDKYDELSMDEAFLQKIKKLVLENLNCEEFSPERLANELGYSRSQVHRKLKKITGKSASQYVREIRLAEANMLLRRKVGTVSEISYRVGFSSPVYFSKCFHDHYGITPGEVLKMEEPFNINPGVEKKHIHKKSRGRGKVSALISVLIIIVVVAYYIIGNMKQSSDISRLEKSIAVLPLENWSVGEEYSHLGNAFAIEIISELWKINQFRIISFPSSSQYNNPDKPSIPQIGRELGANFIIGGSIERQDKKVIINIWVIQANNDFHIWAKKFEGQWTDINEIKNDIAFSIANKLETILSPSEIENISKIPTENTDAFNYYLLGSYYYSRSIEEQDMRVAIDMYQKAIELDPSFALAYTKLACCHLQIYWYQYDRSIDRLFESKKAIDAAIDIAPDLSDAYFALGLYYYYGSLDYSEALKQFETAANYMGYTAELSAYIAYVHRRMGNWQKAVKGLLESLNNDPKAFKTAQNIAETYYLLGDYSKSLYYYSQSISINPEYITSYEKKIDLFLKWDGNTTNARKTFEEASLIFDLSLHPNFTKYTILLDIYEGEYQKAIDFLTTTNVEAVQNQFYYYPMTLYYAMLYDLIKEREKAIHYYDLSRIALETKVQSSPYDPRLFSSLGICYAGLGQKEEAIQIGKYAVELLPISKEAFGGVFRLEDLSRIYVMTGDIELALEQLDYLLSIPGILSPKLLLLDPIWEPLWSHPDFIQLIDKYSDN